MFSPADRGVQVFVAELVESSSGRVAAYTVIPVEWHSNYYQVLLGVTASPGSRILRIRFPNGRVLEARLLFSC